MHDDDDILVSVENQNNLTHIKYVFGQKYLLKTIVKMIFFLLVIGKHL